MDRAREYDAKQNRERHLKNICGIQETKQKGKKRARDKPRNRL